MKIYKLFLFGIVLLFSAHMLSCQKADFDINKNEIAEGETLETYFNKPINKFYMNQLSNVLSKDEDFNGVDISFEDNKIIYSLYCKEYLGKGDKVEKTLRKYIEENKDSLFKELRTTIDLEGEYSAEYIYYNDDYSKAADIIVFENSNTGFFLDNDNSETKLIDNKTIDNDEGSAVNPNTLEYIYNNYYGDDDDNEYINGYKNNYSGVFSNIEIECHENTISYSFYFLDDMGDVQNNVESNMNDEEKVKIINSIKSFFNFYDTIAVEYIYYNPDGSIAAKIEFKG